MNTSICLVCQNPDDRFLCDTCWNQLAVELADLGGYQRNANGERMIPMAVELEIVLSRQDRLGKVTVQVTGSTERPLPVNLHAGRVRDRLHGILAGWVTRICLSRNYCQNTAASMVDNAQWLLGHEDDVRALHDVDELFTTITEAIDAARRLIDNRAIRVYVGICGARIEEEGEETWTCNAALWADSSYAMTRCNVCETSWPSMDRWTTYLAQVKMDRLNAAGEMHLGPRKVASVLTALGLPVDESTVRKWSRQGKIVSTGQDDQGRKTYLVSDVMEQLAQGTPVDDTPTEALSA